MRCNFPIHIGNLLCETLHQSSSDTGQPTHPAMLWPLRVRLQPFVGLFCGFCQELSEDCAAPGGSRSPGNRVRSHNGNFIKDRILSGARACACMCVCVLVGCAPRAGIVIIRWSGRPGCSSSSAASHSLMPRGVCVCERARARLDVLLIACQTEASFKVRPESSIWSIDGRGVRSRGAGKENEEMERGRERRRTRRRRPFLWLFCLCH